MAPLGYGRVRKAEAVLLSEYGGGESPCGALVGSKGVQWSPLPEAPGFSSWGQTEASLLVLEGGGCLVTSVCDAQNLRPDLRELIKEGYTLVALAQHLIPAVQG